MNFGVSWDGRRRLEPAADECGRKLDVPERACRKIGADLSGHRGARAVAYSGAGGRGLREPCA